MKFTDLHLDPSLQAAIDSTGFTECTPIQEQAFYPIVEGKDVAGLAQTGTGKTAAFLIPLMERILKSRPQPPELSPEAQELVNKRAFTDWRAMNLVLILVPTRELAEQVYENVKTLGSHAGFKSVAIYGGTGYDKQRDGLKNGVEFVAATPGRLIDLYKDNQIDLKQVRTIVFDEADRMFDMGFKDDMKYILSRVPEKRQFLVFSATLNFEVLNTAYQFGSEPVEINISRDATTADNVKDQIYHCGNEEKGQHLLSILKLNKPRQAIIFTNYKHSVDRIAKFLNDNGVPAMGISSLLSQGQRTKVIESFKADNDQNVLVATDVAARGLDIKGVDLVVNFDMPNDAESYVHRIGRTGRAGAEGKAASFVSDRDVDSLMRVEEYLKEKRQVGYLEDADLVKEYKSMHNDYNSGRALQEATAPRNSGGRPARRNDRPFDKRRGPSVGGPRDGRTGDRPHSKSNEPRGEFRDRKDTRGEHKGPPRERKPHDGAAWAGHAKKKPAHAQATAHKKPHGDSSSKPVAKHAAGGKKTFRTSASKPAHVKSQSLGTKVKGFFKKILGG